MSGAAERDTAQGWRHRQRPDYIHTCRAAGLEMSTTGLLNVFVGWDFILKGPCHAKISMFLRLVSGISQRNSVAFVLKMVHYSVQKATDRPLIVLPH